MIKKKALLVTTVSGFVPQFEMNNVHILQGMGYEVHYASNYHMPSYGKDNHRLDGTGIVRHQIDFVRSPYSWKNLTAYRQLLKLMRDEQFRLVHCHTPMGAALTRLAAHKLHLHPVLYTAHGFHFYKGAPLRNRLIYHSMEYLLSAFTDWQICINQEDYQAACRMHARHVIHTPGVGIIPEAIAACNVDPEAKRRELGIGTDQKVLLSAGELIHRKNHETVLRAVAQMDDKDLVYVICGHGELEGYLKQLAEKLGIGDQVLFLGYRQDIYELYRIADVFVFLSYQEGLPIALLEALASGAAVVCSDIRGNSELVDEGLGGYRVQPEDIDGVCQAVGKLLSDRGLREQFGDHNRRKAQGYSLEKVGGIMQAVYRQADQEASEP